MTSGRRLSAALALVAFSLANGGAMAGPSNSFGDWYTECTDGGDCFAMLSIDRNGGYVSLVLTRGRALEAGLELELRFAPDAAPNSAILGPAAK